LYSGEKEMKFLEGIVKNKLPELERERHKMLNNDFDPKNCWWGRKVTKE